MAADRRIIIGTHVSPQKYRPKNIPLKASSSRSMAAIEGTLENVDHDKAAYTKSTSEVAASSYHKYIIDDEAKAIQVLADEGMTLYHEEHAPITVPPGKYQIKIVQEFNHMTQSQARVWD